MRLTSSPLLLVLLLTGALHLRGELPQLPRPATSFGAVIVDGWIYTYGGNSGKAHEFNTDTVRGDFFRLQLAGGKAWEELPPDLALLSASLVVHDRKIIRIGGMNARNAKGARNDLYSTDEVERFDPVTRQWSPLVSLPKPRSSHDAVVIGDTLYVGGGWMLAGDDGEGTHAQWADTLLILDLRAPDRGWQLQPQPFQRRALAIAAHGGKIWFIGGMDANDEPSRAVDWFEPATKRWGKGPDLPDGSMAGFGIAAVQQEGHLYVSPLSGRISQLAADESKWEEVTKLTPARFFHRLLALSHGQLLAVGGSNRQGQVKEIEIVSLTRKKAEAAPLTQAVSTEPARVKQPTERGGAEWPQWRGPNRDGISSATGWRKDWPAEGPPKLWSAQAGEGVSSPVVVDGRLIAHGSDGRGKDSIVALDAAHGFELWRFSFPCKADAHEMPIVPNGPGATPTVSRGKVFLLSREGDLIALDVANGQLAWRKHLVNDLGGKRPVYGYAQSPLVDDGCLFLDIGAEQGKTGSTISLDAATGEERWRGGSGEAGYSSARHFERNGQRFIAMFKGEALDVFDPTDGRIIWSHRTTARDFTNTLTPVFVGHRILVSNTGEPFAKLLDWDLGAAPNVRETWSHQQFAFLFNNPVLLDGTLFAFNEKRRGHVEFTAVDATTGKTHWVSDAVPLGTFILADRHWLFLTRDGEVVVTPASATELKPVARFKAVEGKCYATPALAQSRLYVRSNAGEVAAFDLRAPDKNEIAAPILHIE